MNQHLIEIILVFWLLYHHAYILLYFSKISGTKILMVQMKIRLGKYLFYYSEWSLTAYHSMLTADFIWLKFWQVSCTMPYTKLYIWLNWTLMI